MISCVCGSGSMERKPKWETGADCKMCGHKGHCGHVSPPQVKDKFQRTRAAFHNLFYSSPSASTFISRQNFHQLPYRYTIQCGFHALRPYIFSP